MVALLRVAVGQVHPAHFRSLAGHGNSENDMQFRGFRLRPVNSS